MKAALSLGLCLLVTPAGAWAQTAAPAAQAQSAGVVVVADAAADETENAALRAQVYESARAKGWQAEGKADVMGKAQSAGALEAGNVSRENEKLESLRSALGVRALVRIFRDDAGLHVAVVTSKGAQTRDVASNEAAVAAAAELLGNVKQGGAATPIVPGPAGDGAAPAQSGQASLSAGFMTRSDPLAEEQGPPPDSPEGRRLAWENRGGARATYGARALLTGLYAPGTAFADADPVSNQLEVGEGNTLGIGGGLGAHVGVMFLPVPEPVAGSSNFAAFRLNVGAELNGLYVRSPDGFKYRVENGVVISKDKTFVNKGYLYAFIPIQLGVHFMFGKHRSPTVWRGIGLGLTYSPTVIAALEIGRPQDETETKFNYGGFELSLDLVKIETDEKANANIRLGVMVLPKVSDDLPWLASGTIGMFWY
jgi:hypothetical protein